MVELPPDLLADGLGSAGCGQAGRLGGIRGGTQGVRTHMGNARGLSRSSRGGRRCRSLNGASGATSDESAADQFGDAELATSESPCPQDRVTGPAIVRSFGLEQPQHPLCTVRRPHRDDPPIGFAQRLRRDHAHIFAVPCEQKRLAAVRPGPGDIVIVPPKVPHKFTNNGPGPANLVCIHASPTFVTEWLQ